MTSFAIGSLWHAAGRADHWRMRSAYITDLAGEQTKFAPVAPGYEIAIYGSKTHTRHQRASMRVLIHYSKFQAFW